MTRLIDDVFKKQKFIPEQMSEFGFQKIEDTYTYEENFLDDSFRAVVTVKNGKVDGQVIDCSTGDEYYQIDVLAMQGKFVSSVRASYLDILERIVDHCCLTMPFASPQPIELRAGFTIIITSRRIFLGSPRITRIMESFGI